MTDKEKDLTAENNYDPNSETEVKFEIHESSAPEEQNNALKGTDTHHHHHHHSHSHHSGSHRHSHSHHHRRRSKRSKNPNKSFKESFVNFIKDNKKYLTYTIAAILIVVALSFLGIYLDNRSAAKHDPVEDAQTPGVNSTTDSLQISVPIFSEDVEIINSAMKEYIDAEVGVSAEDVYEKYKTADNRLDIGRPVNISCSVTGIPSGCSVAKAELFVSENEDMTSPQVYETSGYDISFQVCNLKSGTRYYYRINVSLSNGTETFVGGSFATAQGPRVLAVEGVYNMRDIGGYTTTDGKIIKQGLLYRGCEIDGAVRSQYTITQNGVNTMLTTFGIKTDMDLRAPTDNKYGTDALGASVEHIYYGAPMYSSVFDSPDGAETIRKIFSDLSDSSKYPIYLHCTYGQDRTGTVCYLLEALLGLDEATMMKEYQLSAFHHGGVASDEMNMFIGRLKGLPGATMKDKVEGYLLSIGVTEAEIAGIRSIFLGE